MCELILAFRQQAEPDTFDVPHEEVAGAIASLRRVKGEDLCSTNGTLWFDFWGKASTPIFANSKELRYVDLNVCDMYVEEARRAAIVAASKTETPGKDKPHE